MSMSKRAHGIRIPRVETALMVVIKRGSSGIEKAILRTLKNWITGYSKDGVPVRMPVPDISLKGMPASIIAELSRSGIVPAPTLTCAEAAAKGLLGALQWARAQGCPWDERTCARAAKNGHLEVLQWLRANGCP